MKFALPVRRNDREAVPSKPEARRRRRRWPLLVGGLVALLAVLAVWRVQAARTPAAVAAPTATVTKGDLDITTQGSGSVQPARSVDLPFQAAGQVREVLVKAGDRVKTGQPLAHLDTRDLQLQVEQAAANLKSAQAKLDQARNGAATPQDVAQGKAQIQAAEAALDKARTGNTTPADIKNAQAGVAAAQDKLKQTQHGSSTPADIASAQASIRNAQANLQKVRTGNTTPADIASAQASIRNAEANLQKVRTGNTTPADIASAQAAVNSAQAKLDAAKAGPLPEQVSAAQAKLKQAQESLQKTGASDSAAKTTAVQSLAQAADNVRLAQQAFSTAYWNDQQAQRGIDPKTNKSFSSEKLDSAPQQQQYAAALHDAQVQLDQAQSKLQQAQVASDNAQQQETHDIANAQAQVDDAQVQLEQLLQGPKPTDLIPLQSAVDQAKAGLAKLQQGPTAADLAAAQAQVDQAKAGLAKLQQGGSASDIAIARDSVTQAQAQLDKARAGGTAADIASAQAQLEQTQANVEKLTAPAAEPDIATAEAGVAQAGAQLESAKLTLDHGTLFAPFDGTLGAVSVVPGSIVSASTAAVTLTDRSSLHIDLNMSESDVGRLQTGQPVKLTFDALPGTVISGTVETIATNSTVQQNVVTYLVQVRFDPGATPVKLGMTANANITVQTVKDVVLVPNRAIQTQGRNHTVQVVYGNRQVPVTVTVETGATNGQLTEITNCTDTNTVCLNPGDQLVLATQTAPTRNPAAPGGTRGGIGGFIGGGR